MGSACRKTQSAYKARRKPAKKRVRYETKGRGGDGGGPGATCLLKCCYTLIKAVIQTFT